MQRFFRILLLILIGAYCLGCSPSSKSQQELKDINKVISGLEKRREIEIRKINVQEKQIKQLKENRENVNSDGMREKIGREIILKESVIEKSRANEENQTKILDELYVRRDSIKSIIENEKIK